MSISSSLDGFKNIKLDDLDFNNLGSWPAPARVIACLILCVLVLGAGYYFYLQDLQSELERAGQQELSLKQQFENKAAMAANLEAYKEQMNEMELQFGELLAKLPADTEVPSLLDDITKIGLGTGLEFEEIKLLPEVTTQFYIELPIQISVIGTYHDFASFVSGTAGLQRIVTLHDFEIVPYAQKDMGNKLKMNILAKTYRYNDQGVAK